MHLYTMNHWTLILLIIIIIRVNLQAQSDTLLKTSIEPIQIKALRIETDQLSAPVSINVHDVSTLQKVSQQLSLQEYMTNSAGVFMMNANNYAQDLRISIRGYGARAAFGIRGIKLIVDGIPETTPDGQGQVDNLVLSQIKQIEVIKGPSSSIYGNASGGVILISSYEDFDKNYVEGALTLGSYGMSQYRLSGGWKNEQSKFIMNLAKVSTDGYRAQSGFESYNISSRLYHQISESTELRFQLNYTDSPTADDAGGLNADAVEADRRQARDRNVEFATGESISQFKVGANLKTNIKDNLTLDAYTFWSNRKFEGLLPFEFGAWINLDRQYWGAGTSINHRIVKGNSVFNNKMGIDIARQSDQRDRYRNIMGIQGDQTLSQIENFNNVGLYYASDWRIKKWLISVGSRWDINQLSAEDLFLTNGEDSGSRSLNALSTSASIGYRVNENQNLYFSYRYGFETPSLSEISANPSGQAGFNKELEAQKSNNVELGWKAIYSRLELDIALFHIDTRNELVPFELEAFPDRIFFRNAGTGNRKGIEIAASYDLTEELSISGSYSYADMTYSEFIAGDNDFSGNILPGIPTQFGNLQLSYTDDAFSALLSAQTVGELYANDANTTLVPGYQLYNFKAGYKLSVQGFTISPFFGINNLLNTIYNDNIRINAFGGRFFEPAPERHFYGGLKVRI